MNLNSPLIIVFLTCILIAGIGSVSFEEDTSLTPKQAETLAQFRKRVQSILPHKYMEENIYLVRWLRARKFDIDRAEEMLRKHLKWRTDNDVDNLDNEDWELFETEYTINQDGFDKQGRPLVQFNYGEWNIRRVAVSGRINQLVKWTYKMFEDGSKRVRKLQSEGKNVTQFTMLVGMEGFNPVSHACALCMRFYFSLLNVYEEHYNGNLDKLHAIDVIEPARVVFRLLFPLLSENTQKAFVFWGTNRQKWRDGLLKDIDNNQLLQSFGGTLDSKTKS